jgi:hypothetical protein
MPTYDHAYETLAMTRPDDADAVVGTADGFACETRFLQRHIGDLVSLPWPVLSRPPCRLYLHRR